MSSLLLLLFGLIFLLAGAELLVRGASRIAASLGIPPLIIGLTVVAFGTSAPELAVSVKSALAGQADIALGNVVGSNIFNILFILGAAAAITPLTVSLNLIRLDLPFMIFTSLLLWLFSMNGVISHREGAILLTLLAGYLLHIYRQSKKTDPPQTPSQELLIRKSPRKTFLAGLFVITGLVLLVLGAKWFVNGAVYLARLWGISEMVIGLTVVALGTSLPEAATSIVASLKKERDIAIGNIIGSNIFNILCVMGCAAIIAPNGISAATEAVAIHIPVMLAAAVICLPIFFTDTKISRTEGILFLIYYAFYMTFQIVHQPASDLDHSLEKITIWIIVPATALILFLSIIKSRRTLTDLTAELAQDMEVAAMDLLKKARKIMVMVTGGTVLIAGIAMIFLPGPAIIVIPTGLFILSTEFVWAKRLLQRIQTEIKKLYSRKPPGDDHFYCP